MYSVGTQFSILIDSFSNVMAYQDIFPICLDIVLIVRDKVVSLEAEQLGKVISFLHIVSSLYEHLMF